MEIHLNSLIVSNYNTYVITEISREGFDLYAVVKNPGKDNIILATFFDFVFACNYLCKIIKGHCEDYEI